MLLSVSLCNHPYDAYDRPGPKLAYADNEGTDQTVHPRSLIRPFAIYSQCDEVPQRKLTNNKIGLILSCPKQHLLICAPSEDLDQTAHSCSLIRIFTRRILDT